MTLRIVYLDNHCCGCGGIHMIKESVDVGYWYSFLLIEEELTYSDWIFGDEEGEESLEIGPLGFWECGVCQ